MTRREPIDGALLRRVYGRFPSGVTAVAAIGDGEPMGLAASSFTSVSMDPPIVSVCVAHSSTTWPALSGAQRIGVSVLGAHQQDVARAMAGAGDRFAGVGWRTSDDGAVLVDGAAAWFDCTVHDTVPAGDHDVVLLRIHDLADADDVLPLIFHGSAFRALAP